MTNNTQTKSADRADRIRELAALGVNPSTCGLHKLNMQELRALAYAIRDRVNEEGRRAFNAAMGR
jgi:hypothetical protein